MVPTFMFPEMRVSRAEKYRIQGRHHPARISSGSLTIDGTVTGRGDGHHPIVDDPLKPSDARSLKASAKHVNEC